MNGFSGIRVFQMVLRASALIGALAAGWLLLMMAIAARDEHNLQEQYKGTEFWLYLIWAFVSAISTLQCWAYSDLLDIAVYIVEQTELQRKLLNDAMRELR
jgi:hypothetical protein